MDPGGVERIHLVVVTVAGPSALVVEEVADWHAAIREAGKFADGYLAHKRRAQGETRRGE